MMGIPDHLICLLRNLYADLHLLKKVAKVTERKIELEVRQSNTETLSCWMDHV